MINENRNWKQNLEGLERSWETIGISNDFLFGKLMRNIRACARSCCRESCRNLKLTISR